MGDIAKSETAFDDTTDEKPFVDLDASELTAVDIDTLLGPERQDHQKKHPVKHTRGLRELRERVVKCFKALNTCRATDMHVGYNESGTLAIRRAKLAPRFGVLVRVEDCGRAPELWFISDEMLLGGRGTRNKLAAEAGHLSFQYQSMLKSASVCECSINFTRRLEDSALEQGVWCQQLSDNIRDHVTQLEAEVVMHKSKAFEFANTMPICFVSQQDAERCGLI